MNKRTIKDCQDCLSLNRFGSMGKQLGWSDTSVGNEVWLARGGYFVYRKPKWCFPCLTMRSKIGKGPFAYQWHRHPLDATHGKEACGEWPIDNLHQTPAFAVAISRLDGVLLPRLRTLSHHNHAANGLQKQVHPFLVQGCNYVEEFADSWHGWRYAIPRQSRCLESKTVFSLLLERYPRLHPSLWKKADV